jgi:hypothetical protein
MNLQFVAAVELIILLSMVARLSGSGVTMLFLLKVIKLSSRTVVVRINLYKK